MKVIEVNNLIKTYGTARGINNISFNIEKGDIVGFIGPNGAGKSTTIKILLNMIFKNEGQAKIFGLDCEEDSKEIKKRVGYVQSEVRIYENMKVKDIIKYSKSFYNDIDNERIEEICAALKVDLDKKMGELSLGNKKKVAIVQALVHSPELIILDEPTNGLDPLMQRTLFNIILEENKKGKTIFLSSHNLTEIENYCHKAIVIKEGKIIAAKDMREFKKAKNKKITIYSDEEMNEGIEKLGGKILRQDDGKVEFRYSGEINKLIKFLSGRDIKDMCIEEENLEESFMQYYEGE